MYALTRNLQSIHAGLVTLKEMEAVSSDKVECNTKYGMTLAGKAYSRRTCRPVDPVKQGKVINLKNIH